MLAGSSVDAKSITLNVTVHGTSLEICAGVLRLADREQTLPLKERVALEVSSATSVSLSSERCWAPAVAIDPKVDSIELPVWPRATLRGSVTVPERASQPKSLTLRVQGARENSPAIGPFESTCEIREGRWRCGVPGGVSLDLRFAAPGFVPHYVWDVFPSVAEVKDLGALALHQGASIRGWVRSEERSGAKVTVELQSAAVKVGRAESAVLRKSSPNARGFFQFEDVPPGVYDVVARAEGWSPSRAAGVRVDEGREYALDALVIRRLCSLDVTVSPALSADGSPWTLILNVYKSQTIRAPLVKITAGVDGRHVFEKLEPGRYDVAVLDANGSAFEHARVAVEQDGPPLLIHLEQVLVRGTLTSGDHPLRARLEFRQAGGDVPMQSKEDGSFSGVLPKEGKWQVWVEFDDGSHLLRKVEVKRRKDEDVAVVDIRLPGGQARGKVVDERGQALGNVSVVVMKEGRSIANLSTSSDGSFHLRGLEPGGVTLRAETRDGQSADLPYSVMEDDPFSAQLVVHRLTKVRAFVATADGNGVPGAFIRWYVPELHDINSTVTDESGRFTFSVPAETTLVTVTIMPASYPIHIAVFPVDRDSDDVRRITIGTQPARLNLLTKAAVVPPSIQVPGGIAIPVNLLLYPRDGSRLPRGYGNGGFALELDAGTYRVCVPRDPEECKTLTLAAGSEQTLDARDARPRPGAGEGQ